ncbi:glycosyltransferase family 32 protein [Acerihabitans arboris]|uniref:Uncharacterized protein n=1 Tax=Acerihabitans arboris TaxID=2691583 RepID=A0A845SCB1_9GAMM|nr:TcdA/TcdB catalytic glycosyltransferase domain-containing protein [Acerihabitans arboris]NDL62390.1 hypothetical protein [Acerihabitans arboris]
MFIHSGAMGRGAFSGRNSTGEAGSQYPAPRLNAGGTRDENGYDAGRRVAGELAYCRQETLRPAPVHSRPPGGMSNSGNRHIGQNAVSSSAMTSIKTGGRHKVECLQMSPADALRRRAAGGNAAAAKIPKIIHYIWLGNPKNISMTALGNIVFSARLNADYKIKLWVDSPHKMKAFLIESGYSAAFFSRVEIVNPRVPSNIEAAIARECTDTRYKNYAAASDILRLSVLEDYGGIYMDVDVALRDKLGDLSSGKAASLENGGALFHIEAREPNNKADLPIVTSNGVIASIKNSRDIHLLLDKVLAHYQVRTEKIGKNTVNIIDAIIDCLSFRPFLKPFLIRLAGFIKPGFAEHVKIKASEEFMWCKKRSEANARLNGTMDTTGPGVIEQFLETKDKYIFENYCHASNKESELLQSLLLNNVDNFGQIKIRYGKRRRAGEGNMKNLGRITEIFGEWKRGLNDKAKWKIFSNNKKSAEV